MWVSFTVTWLAKPPTSQQGSPARRIVNNSDQFAVTLRVRRFPVAVVFLVPEWASPMRLGSHSSQQPHVRLSSATFAKWRVRVRDT